MKIKVGFKLNEYLLLLFFYVVVAVFMLLFFVWVNYTRMKLNATETLDVNYFIASVTRQQTMGYRKMFIFVLL